MFLFSFSMILAGVGLLMAVHPKLFTNHLYHLLFIPLFEEKENEENIKN